VETKINAPAIPRPAATLVVLRDTPAGPEVLMMRRNESASFGSGAYVFPGGRVDDTDRGPAAYALSPALSDADASAQLGLESDGLAYWIAAIRETLEEAGLLFAGPGSGAGHDTATHNAVTHNAATHNAATHNAATQDRTTRDPTALRNVLHAGAAGFTDLMTTRRVQLDTASLAYLARWITHAGRPRRFDTRFFIARAPSGQTVSHDGHELVEHLWIRPEEALERHRRGQLQLMFPTLRTLESLRSHNSVEAALAWARSPREQPVMVPVQARSAAGPVLLLPGDHAYAEIARLDPEGSGTFSAEREPGIPMRLSARLQRLCSTRGVNSYLLGRPEEGLALIDPGPEEPAHIEALLAHAGPALRWVVLTHTHRAHAGALAALRARRPGLQVLGMPPRDPRAEDVAAAIDRVLEDGQVLALGGVRLQVLHTPGHAENHLCFIDPEERTVFSGDHLVQSAHAARIDPFPGAMQGFIATMARLRREPLAWIAPGHGFLMDRPQEMIDRALNARLARETEVLEAIRDSRCASEDDVLALAFRDIPEQERECWRPTLRAHLAKVASEGAPMPGWMPRG
jgi:glyoxylase-like metal-dependent hydrolase (beta-lactamase superfamily II)/8-oxo-dGTP pyrophosphatase MutT (NUDIX family)